MVESAPMFIEYCCEGYMLMRGVTALCICSFISAVFACFLSSLFHTWLERKHSCDYPGSSFSREANAALSAFDCEDVTCNDLGENNETL